VQASSHIKGAAEFDGGIRVAPLRKKGVTPTWRIPEPSGRFALSLIDRRCPIMSCPEAIDSKLADTAGRAGTLQPVEMSGIFLRDRVESPS
jgi:hypothetical protein